MLKVALLQLRQQRVEQQQQQPAVVPLQQVAKVNSLLSLRPVLRLCVPDVAQRNTALAQLDFSIRLYLHLSQGGSATHKCHLRNMQKLDLDVLDIRPGALDTTHAMHHTTHNHRFITINHRCAPLPAP